MSCMCSGVRWFVVSLLGKGSSSTLQNRFRHSSPITDLFFSSQIFYSYGQKPKATLSSPHCGRSEKSNHYHHRAYFRLSSIRCFSVFFTFSMINETAVVGLCLFKNYTYIMPLWKILRSVIVHNILYVKFARHNVELLFWSLAFGAKEWAHFIETSKPCKKNNKTKPNNGKPKKKTPSPLDSRDSGPYIHLILRTTFSGPRFRDHTLDTRDHTLDSLNHVYGTNHALDSLNRVYGTNHTRTRITHALDSLFTGPTNRNRNHALDSVNHYYGTNHALGTRDHTFESLNHVYGTNLQPHTRYSGPHTSAPIFFLFFLLLSAPVQ